MLPRSLDCASYLFRADGKPRVVLLYQKLQRHAAGKSRLSAAVPHKFRHAGNLQKFRKQSLLLEVEIVGHAARAQKSGKICALPINYYLAGSQPLAVHQLGVNRAVLHRQHSHRYSVEKLVLAAFDGIVRPLERYETLNHGNAPEAARPEYGNLSYKREIPLSVRAVPVRQRSRINEHVARNDDKLAVRLLLCGLRISFNHQHGVLFDLLGHAGHRLVVAASAHRSPSVKRKYLKLLSGDVHAPDFFDLPRRICLCVNYALAFVEVGAHAAVGINFKGRNYAHRNVPAGVNLVVAFDSDALFFVP